MATKKKVGRPPIFQAAEDLAKCCSDYINSESQKMPTKAGLCLWLRIHKDTYNEYKKRPEFTDTLKRVELEIEDAWNQRLTSQSVAGAIFYLKNAFKEEYKDRYDTDITTKGEKIVFVPEEILTKHALRESPSSTKPDSK